jgi:hypothetical protein
VYPQLLATLTDQEDLALVLRQIDFVAVQRLHYETQHAFLLRHSLHMGRAPSHSHDDQCNVQQPATFSHGSINPMSLCLRETADDCHAVV